MLIDERERMSWAGNEEDECVESVDVEDLGRWVCGVRSWVGLGWMGIEG